MAHQLACRLTRQLVRCLACRLVIMSCVLLYARADGLAFEGHPRRQRLLNDLEKIEFCGLIPYPVRAR